MYNILYVILGKVLSSLYIMQERTQNAEFVTIKILPVIGMSELCNRKKIEVGDTLL